MTTTGSTRPTRARCRARRAGVRPGLDRQRKGRSSSTLWPTTSSNSRLTSTVDCPEGCDDGLQPLAQPFAASSPVPQPKRATFVPDSGTKMALNSRRRPAAQNFVCKPIYIAHSLRTHQNSSPGPLVTARALAHELRRRFVTRRVYSRLQRISSRLEHGSMRHQYLDPRSLRRSGWRKSIHARH
ncbi:hypothetical protein DFP72DRAFT_150637 [Ephemerocybe angulata]|uniref:Uncharacterized protein n=1 Tax=Ephemerocybe angulata TaxID=980116 RepID=A0A8H6I7C3_9AGAR|nr:hypothetical protein DFP72DRAFT_150637 [Tulosesus angulatus]